MYEGSESDSDKEFNLLDISVPSPAGSSRQRRQGSVEGKSAKKTKKAGPCGPSEPGEPIATRAEVGSPGVVKLTRDPREEILEFCTQIAKQTTMLYERECRMDSLLQAIIKMVDCTEASDLEF